MKMKYNAIKAKSLVGKYAIGTERCTIYPITNPNSICKIIDTCEDTKNNIMIKVKVLYPLFRIKAHWVYPNYFEIVNNIDLIAALRGIKL